MQERDSLPIDTNPSLKDVQFLEDRINEFTVQTTGITNGELLAIFVHADENTIENYRRGFREYFLRKELGPTAG